MQLLQQTDQAGNVIVKLGKNHCRAVKNLCNARWEIVVSYVHELNFVICIFKDITIKILFFKRNSIDIVN